jgi:putative DNA primase/helicase
MAGFTNLVIRDIWQEAEASTGAKQARLKEWWHESQSSARIASMLKLVRSESNCHAEPREFNLENWLLPVSNGTLDLKAGKILLPDPKNKFTRVSPVRFDAARTCPKWELFLSQVLPDAEVRAFIQQYVGYCLTGDVSARLMLVCIGTGRNGKSLFLRVLADLLGVGEFATVPSGELLLASQNAQHPTEFTSLFGARVAVLSEIRKGRQWDEEKLKKLTGNDIIACRKMGEDWWSYTPTCKLIVATNTKPRVADVTDSFWDRIALVPFSVRIRDEEEDKALLPKLRGELSGILNWALKGCASYVRQGGFKLPPACVEARDSYRRDEDQLGECLNDVLVLTPLGRVSNEEVTRLVGDWCAKAGKSMPWSKRTISVRLKELGLTETRSGQLRGWAGASLRKDEKTPKAGWKKEGVK